MSLYAIPAVAALVINSILAVYLLLTNPRRTENRLFAFMLLFFAIWDVGEIIMRTTNDINVAIIGTHMFLLGGFLAGAVYFVFTLFFPNKNRYSNNKYLMAIIVILCTVVVSVDLSTNLTIKSAQRYYWGYSPVYGPFFLIPGLLMMGFIMAGLLNMCMTYIKTDILVIRKRAKFVIVGTMVPIIFGSPSGIIFPLLGRTVIELPSTLTVVMGGFIAYAILRYKVLIVPVTEETESKEAQFKLNRGQSYLIEEEKPNASFRIFVNLVSYGAHGLCVTRRPPESIRDGYGLQKTPIIWLSRTVDDKMCIDPAMTAELSMTIKDFLEESKNGVVLLDGLEYLIVHNNFHRILKFIHDLNESIAVHKAILIIPVDKRILNEKEYALLERDINKLPLNAEFNLLPTILGKGDGEWVTV